ncbi:MAG TPA: lysine transporter LysE [Armatimonadetes bacterium]|nr:lysine transporter LysE [Armatimonadota bacterium]
MWLLSIFFGSLMVAFSGALMPGPVTITAIERSARSGALAAVFVAMGHSALELVTTIALAIGLLKANVPLLKIIIGLLGGCALIWMGIGMMRASKDAQLPQAGQSESSHAHWSAMLAGVLTSISNPYWAIWWLTIGASYVAFSWKWNVCGLTAFYLGHISGDIIWLALLGIAVAKGSMLMSTRAYRWLLRSCSLVIILFGGLFIGMAFHATVMH